MMKIFFILLTVCFFLLVSCTKEAKVKLPEVKSMPVIYSYISPADSVVRLKLLASSPLFSSNQIDVLAPVPDGDVKISSAQGTAQLIFNQNTGYYELNTNSYPIIPGQVYKMTVTTIKGDVATAETQVPLTVVPINTVTVNNIQVNSQTSDIIKAFFTDEANSVNYYRIGVSHCFVYMSQTDTIINDTKIFDLYSDLNHDGESSSLAGRFSPGTDSSSYYSTEHYDIYLYNCSESYYKFYKSLENDPGSGISFPPPAEPNHIYSNVKGGFGCFGAYVYSRVRYKKK